MTQQDIVPAELRQRMAENNCEITPSEFEFIRVVRELGRVIGHERGAQCGYGWMQGVIEWIWKEQAAVGSAPPAWGPEIFEEKFAELTKKIEALESRKNEHSQ